MITKVRTVDFLPEIFRTDTNKQFLSATLDVLTQQSNLLRVEGFIGEKYGYGVEPNDHYVTEPTSARRNYQFDPSVVFLKPDTQIAQDFINYPGILNALNNQNGLVNDSNRLFESDFYSWDPFVDYDKIVNYAQYYWIPSGPDAIPITVTGNITTEILGQLNYISDNGIEFTNGLKILFDSSVTPSLYAETEYFVEGVGTEITLLPVDSFIVTEPSGSTIYGLWDQDSWDISNWDAELYASVFPDYITISRNSRDYNAWTRSNRWFHQQVIDTTIAALGQVTSISSNAVTRAQRPILEFRGNLKLFNSGLTSTGPVTFFDTSITDALVSINGQSSYQIDGQFVSDGDTVIFSADTDPVVRRTIYQINFVPAGPGGSLIITVIPSTTVSDQSQTFVKRGLTNNGRTFRYISETGQWTQCQLKTSINQCPLYDIFDSDGISIGNTDIYNSSTFVGTKLFSYTIGTGRNDPVLGFPIKYSSVTNIGDISFTVNLNSDTFNYKNSQNQIITENINIGFVHDYSNESNYNLLTGWIPAAAPSIQYQTFEFSVTAETTEFVCDVPAVNELSTAWNPVQIFINDEILDSTQYTVTVDLNNFTTTITLDDPATVDSKVTILVYSESVSSTAYYTIPSNLQNNPFNQDIISVDVGDIRNQYKTIYANAPGVVGSIYGNNNVHDLGNLNKYGTSIIQNSASLVLPGLFLRKSQINFFDALQYNRDQYTLYKSLITDIAFTNDYSIDQTPAEILDSIIYEITLTKTNTTTFFWTPIIYSGAPYITNTYTFGAAPSTAIFTLDRVYTTDKANYYAVALYVTRIINGESRTIQLIRDIDYVISSSNASVTVTASLNSGDTLTVKEYNQTYGSYCPSTPSSLGLYPSYIPEIIYDANATIPAYFIRGHDGSMTRCYGDYVDGFLTDFRDIALFEFEIRIFNNIKTSGTIPLIFSDVAPGQFRTTDYSNQEILDIYSPEFLNWVGSNRIDYKTQFYNLANPFTFNYNQSSNKLDDSVILRGYWRGIYQWLYDTDAPNVRPWEMLGLSIKPDWWETRYGPSPYTSGNTYLWTDLSNGYVWNDGNPYTNTNCVRSQLLDILPVNSLGELRNPFEVIVGNYNKLAFKKNWVVGDQSPAESAYLKSSDWPFDLMRILSLTKPAKFFNLFADLDNYNYNENLQQFLFNNRYHLNPTLLEIYGNGTAKNSYINWIVDYVNVTGVDGYSTVKTLVTNLDVRLTYNLAGFSAKDYLKFYIERATPNSKNTSFLIPDESYGLLLYDNVPEDKLVYSSIIVQRVKNGYTVWGNSRNKNYFTVAISKKNGFFKKITTNNTTVTISNDWYADRNVIVPYGTILYGQQSVAEFINNYGQYLTTQGLIAENIDQGIVYNWDRMIQEFLAWSDQYWELGSTIALNPSAQYLTVNRPGLIVNPLTISDQNFALNQNLIPIQSQNAAIIRENEKFSMKILNDGDTVSYTNFNLSSMEHAVIFDNVTVFNDIIYNLVTGLRQPRLLLKGYKSAEWNGYVDAQGFILNEDNIQEWQSNQKYAKGRITLYKNQYWVAGALVEPGPVFDTSKWFKIDYSQIKTGLLPNPSTNAYESLYYYDSNRANLELDADLLGYSLIGYRSRDYLASADLSDVTTINVYKNIIKEKGTKLLAEGFKNAKLDQGAIDYSIYENWAIQQGSFGKILSSNYVEATLNQNLLTGNPSLLAFSENGLVEQAYQTVLLDDLINYERAPTNQNFLPKYITNYSIENGLPTAGYVNKNDAKYSVFEYDNLNDDIANIQNLVNGDAIWVAKYNNSWGIFVAKSLNLTVTQCQSNLNGTLTITFSDAHGLSKNSLLAIASFSTDIDGFYTVVDVNSIYSVIVEGTISTNSISIAGAGVAFNLVSARYYQASDIADSSVPSLPFNKKLNWIDNDSVGQWQVLGNRPVFQEQLLSVTPGAGFGSSVAYSSKLGKLVGDSVDGTVTIINSNEAITVLTGDSGFGRKIVTTDSACYITSDVYVYYYTIDVTNSAILTQKISLSGAVGLITAIAVSSDNSWLYIAKSDVAEIEIRHFNKLTGLFEASGSLITAPVGATGWGTSIACSIDGVKLIVGAPQETINGLQNAGAAYIYSRSYQQFLGNGTVTNYTVAGSLNTNRFDVFVNGSLVSSSAYVLNAGNTVQFNIAPADGAVITIQYDNISLIQRIVSDSPKLGALYGQSVDTNRFGSNIVVGCPNDINTVDNLNGIEGSVYQIVNGGQRYGQITCVNPSVLIGDQIFLDGYQMTFSMTTNDANVIAEQINSGESTNIVASSTNNTLYITTKSQTADIIGNVIDLVASSVVQSRLNLTLYVNTQIIYNPNLTTVSKFGEVIKMNERDGLLISATLNDRYSPATFDFSNDCIDNDTIFDGAATTFVDSFANAGAVHQYTYLEAYNESISNPGKYVFGQYINTSNTEYGYQPKFGSSLAYKNNVIMIGAQNWYTDGAGFATSFVPDNTADCDTYTNISWYIDKIPTQAVDIKRINNISIYNLRTNSTIDYLDYIDPIQGKLLGAVSSNLDYISSTDPAGYTNHGIQWGESQVGSTWLDTTNLRLYNYYQPDPVYNAVNWGKAFVGSSADIYTWVSSSVSPLNYTGSGVVTNVEKYIVKKTYNSSKNAIVDVYYFWVKNLDIVPEGKTLSPIVIGAYILNPMTSGIPYIAASTVKHNESPANIIAIYNANSSIADISTAIHIGYGNGVLQDTKHTEWKLINSDNEYSFLPGLPIYSESDPTDLYLKYLDSFSGMNTDYNAVPDTRLPILVQSGVNFNPRQTMFMDRRTALKNFIDYANSVLRTQPIRETRNLSLLETKNTIEGFTMLSSCVTATSNNLSAVYNNGILGVGATLSGIGSLPAISDVTANVGNRILVKNQNLAQQNGIYTVTTVAPNWVLTRTQDFDSNLYSGLSTAITNGTTRGTVWSLIASGLISVGVSAIIFNYTSSTPKYDTTQFWEYVDWWAEGYDSTVKPTLEVQNYIELQTFASGTLITSSNGLMIELTDGLIVKIKLNAQGFNEYYRYIVTESENYWTRIGVQSGTIQIKATLWENTYAWDDEPWDYDLWDRVQGIEVRNIVRWINEVLYTNDLLIERNNSLILMFNYIQSENLERANYNPWLTKTSLIDVKQQVRKLLQYKKYQRDNQEFLNGYLNEIKPFHVKIKNFIYSYDGEEVYHGNITDFDLPAELNTVAGKFITPMLVYQTPTEDNQYLSTDDIWQANSYSQWYNNYGLNLGTNTIDTITITRLAADLTVSDSSARLFSCQGLSDTGIIIVDNEQIYYETIDRNNLIISDLQRGYNSTEISAHAASTEVFISAVPVIVLNGGRGYASPPSITASVDTSMFPVPRSNAEFQTTITDGTLSTARLTVTAGLENIGSGYAVDPTITVSGSPVLATFIQSSITANNEILIPGHPFVTGDTVVYTTSTPSINYGPTNKEYYYVRTLDSSKISLYRNFKDTANTWIGLTTLSGSIDDSTTSIVVNDSNMMANLNSVIEIDDERISYTGINYSTGALIGVTRGVDGTIAAAHANNSQVKVNDVKYAAKDLERVKLLTGSNTAIGLLQCTGRVQVFTESYPVRMFTVKINFDRVSYTDNYRIENFYEPTVNMPGKDLTQLMSGVEYSNSIYLGTDLSANNIDTLLLSPSFTDTVPTIYTVEGGQFPDGYAPEELVPGVVTDNLTITVVSNDGALNFKQTVNKSGIMQTFNTNPYTQTTLESTLSPGSNNIIVANANTVIDNTFSSTGNIIFINGEYIRFKTVNYATNTLSNLERGINGTSISTTVVGGTIAATALIPGIMYKIISVGTTNFMLGGAGTNTVGTVFYANAQCGILTGTGTVKPVIQSVLYSNKLSDDWTDQWWYGPPSSSIANTTLATNTTVPALFLQKITP